MSDKLEGRFSQQAKISYPEGNEPVETTGLLRECGIMTEFQAHVLKPNISGITTIPIRTVYDHPDFNPRSRVGSD